MIVIKGKSEKSLKLESLIQNEFEFNKVLILDAVGYNNWSLSEQFEVWTIEGIKDYKALISEFVKNYEAVKEFNTIAFYVNATEEAIASFRDIDHAYPHNFIVTIQTDEDTNYWKIN